MPLVHQPHERLVGQQDPLILVCTQAVPDDGLPHGRAKGCWPDWFHIDGGVTAVTCAAPTSSRRVDSSCNGECLR